MKASFWRVLGLAVVDAAALTLLWPAVRRTVLTSDTVLRGSADAFAADLAEVALFVVAVWLGVGLAASALAGAPGLAGRIGDTVSGVLLPAVLRRALAGGVGLGVFLAPVAPSAGAAVGHPTAHPTATHSPAGPSVPEHPRRGDTQRIPLPPPVWPTSAPAPTSRPAPRSQLRAGVTVAAGDSLWLIAAHRLGPDASLAQVAAYWPRIYRQNRSVVGADPDVITPGQRLTLPARPAEESTR